MKTNLSNTARLSAVALLTAVSLGGCATIIEGTSQEILVVTNPPGAACVLEREGQPIGTIPTTPGAVLIKKSKHDITIKCNKAGFEEAMYIDDSGLASGSVAGNVAADLLLTAGLSSIIDSASGADNKYESPVNISMVPKIAMSAAPAATAPAATTPAAPTPPTPPAAASTPPATTMAPIADKPADKPKKKPAS